MKTQTKKRFIPAPQTDWHAGFRNTMRVELNARMKAISEKYGAGMTVIFEPHRYITVRIRMEHCEDGKVVSDFAVDQEAPRGIEDADVGGGTLRVRWNEALAVLRERAETVCQNRRKDQNRKLKAILLSHNLRQALPWMNASSSGTKVYLTVKDMVLAAIESSVVVDVKPDLGLRTTITLHDVSPEETVALVSFFGPYLRCATTDLPRIKVCKT